jgi:thiamine-monophosphate kinase
VIDPGRTVGEIGERALLQHLRGRIPGGDGVEIGLGDDAAAVRTGALTLVTTDALVEDVHFVRRWTPARLLGRKALSVNLSDIAAMAGSPRYATVSLCLPRDLEAGFVDGLYDGLLERGAQTGVALVGGNLSATDGPLVIDVTLLGQGDRLLTRAGARPGDRVIVSGPLGAAAEGVRLLRQGARLDEDGRLDHLGIWTASSTAAVTRCLRAHLDPDPPLAFARSLAEDDWAHAAMDISDGLSGDLLALCRESGLQARLDVSAVPVDPAASQLERARGGDAVHLALHGGEDYQLLLAVAPERLDELRERALVWNLALRDLGVFEAGEPCVRLVGPKGDSLLEPASHEHFRAADAGGDQR